MKKIAEIKTVTYDAGDGFLVDIVERVDSRNGIELYEAWIYRDNNGVKQHIYGVDKTTTTKKEFIKLIGDTIEDDKTDYDREDDFIEYAHSVLDDETEADEDCDCENCPYYDEDCDEADSCKDANGEYITLPELIGNDKEVEIANEIRLGFVKFLNEKFVTRHQHSIIAFVRWYLNTYDMAAYWIAYKDSMTDMFFVVDRITEWRNSVC